jgi:hypothetical protein
MVFDYPFWHRLTFGHCSGFRIEDFTLTTLNHWLSSPRKTLLGLEYSIIKHDHRPHSNIKGKSSDPINLIVTVKLMMFDTIDLIVTIKVRGQILLTSLSQ